jgi:hypothetical protein
LSIRTALRVLERPDLRDESIIACLREQHDVIPVQVAFLPLWLSDHVIGQISSFLRTKTGQLWETMDHDSHADEVFGPHSFLRTSLADG